MLSIPATTYGRAMAQLRVEHWPATFQTPLELRNSKKGIGAIAETSLATIDRAYTLRAPVIKNARPITVKAAFYNLLT